MALIVGENSYVTLVEADAWMLTSMYSSEWNELSVTAKETLIISATRVLETLEWVGIIDPASTQTLSWPRIGVFFDPKRGYKRSLKDVGIPDAVKQATFQLVININEDSGLAIGISEDEVEDIKVGPIELRGLSSKGTSVDIISGQPSINDAVYGLIQPYLSSGQPGANTWRRAW